MYFDFAVCLREKRSSGEINYFGFVSQLDRYFCLFLNPVFLLYNGTMN